MARLQVGEIAERYVVRGTLGIGGMGAVYAVTHTKLHTHHALKLLTVRSEDLDRRFLLEGRVAAKLRHANIVSVTDVLELEQGPALLMDLVKGPSLKEVLDKRALSVDEAVQVFRAILHATGAAHDAGFVHRDLKPANIMLAVDETTVTPMVTDFGLAKITGNPGSLSMIGHTASGMYMGTPMYMAPEQMFDAAKVDNRADLYSLGAVMYRMLVGQAPYEQTDLGALIRAMATEPIAPIAQVKPEVPDDLAQVLTRMLDTDPAQRPDSCAEVLQALGFSPHVSEPAPRARGSLVELAEVVYATSPMLRMFEEDLPGQVQIADSRSAATPVAAPARDTATIPATWLGSTKPPAWFTPKKAAGIIGGSMIAIAAAAFALISLTREPEPPATAREVEPAPAAQPATAAPPEPTVDEPIREVADAPSPEPAPEPEPEPEPARRPEVADAPNLQPTAAEMEPILTPPPAVVAEAGTPVLEDPPAPAPAPVGLPLEVTGEHDEAWLTDGVRTVRPGQPVPSGSWTVMAVFDAAPPNEAGTVEVREGERVRLRCTGALRLCPVAQ